MADLLDAIFPVSTPVMSETEVLLFANSEIARFEQFFVALGNVALTRSEAAILRTYLVAVITGRFPSALEAIGTSDASAE